MSYQYFLTLALLCLVSYSHAQSYDRASFHYKSYKPMSSEGFYTKKSCDFINIDHVVSLKDAFDNGAVFWNMTKRSEFANDRLNHVPSCSRVNSSKGSAGPKVFLRRSNDGRGLDYKIVEFCDYVKKYYKVKKKYKLSFKNNDDMVFSTCGLSIQ
jgi:hypothetical protein